MQPEMTQTQLCVRRSHRCLRNCSDLGFRTRYRSGLDEEILSRLRHDCFLNGRLLCP
jgi:hypothetical protein